MSWIVAGVAAGVGALSGVAKNNAAKQQADKQRQLASETQRYSYITHNQAAPVQEAGGMWGDVLQGASSGFGLGQGINSANQANKLNDAKIDYYKNGTPSIYGGSGYKDYGNIG